MEEKGYLGSFLSYPIFAFSSISLRAFPPTGSAYESIWWNALRCGIDNLHIRKGDAYYDDDRPVDQREYKSRHGKYLSW